MRRDRTTENIQVPAGSVVMSPEYYDKLSASMALKDKIIFDGYSAKQENEGLHFNKKIYIDTHYGVKSGSDIVVGGTVELVI